MSYVVFARKWRPLTFDDVVGQEHVTDTLKKAIEKDRVAHAYIFTGTRGVGKTTTARILARALNCDNGPTPTPCGTCDACKNIIGGSSFDVIEIDGASNNSVDDIRELRDNINYSSMGGKYRIYVIDEVHMLSKSAFNALLKTLEEPPPQVIFIFATTEPQKIPATIQSRCQRYDFRRISSERIVRQLAKICTEEHIGFSQQALALIGRKAEGSMRDSLSLLEQVCSFCQGDITEKDVRSVLGVVDTEVYGAVLDAVAAKKPEALLAIVQDTLCSGIDLQEFVIGFEEYLRTLLFVSLPGVLNNERIDLYVDSPDAYSARAAAFTEKTLLRMAEIMRTTENELKWSVYPRFLVELALLKLVYLDSTVSVEQLLEAFKKNSGSTGELPSPEPAPSRSQSQPQPVQLPSAAIPSVTPSAVQEVASPAMPEYGQTATHSDDAKKKTESIETAVSPDDVFLPEPDYPVPEDADDFAATEPIQDAAVTAKWPVFLDTLKSERPMIGYYCEVARVSSPAKNTLDIRFPASCRTQYNEICKKNNRSDIDRIMQTIAGVPVEIHVTLDSQETNSAAPASANIPEQRVFLSLHDQVEREPIIKNILTVFDGEVIT